MLLALVFVFLAGAVGGFVNSLMAGNVRFMPHQEVLNKFAIIQPGILLNVLLGGIAALVSWGLYGPFAAVNVIGGPGGKPPVSLSLSALAGAVLVGVGGAKWLTAHADQKFLRAAGSEAASGPGSPQLARAIAILSPAMAFRAVMGAKDSPGEKITAARKKGRG